MCGYLDTYNSKWKGFDVGLKRSPFGRGERNNCGAQAGRVVFCKFGNRAVHMCGTYII